jgi:rSAM/selenodomain-associated transferase 2
MVILTDPAFSGPGAQAPRVEEVVARNDRTPADALSNEIAATRPVRAASRDMDMVLGWPSPRPPPEAFRMSIPAPVSVIVPTYNEEARIASCLESLRRFSPPWEILVVDGESRDRTIESARSVKSPKAEILSSPRGRGIQLNAGAAVARGEVFLFHHADVSLPDDAPHLIGEALSDPAVVGGAFRTRTIPDGAGSLFQPLLGLADLRSRYTRLPYGDQAVFVRAQVWRRLGGFEPIPVMEDLEFARRLRQEGRIRTVRAAVRVSGRRFMERPIFSAVAMNLFPILFRLGVSPHLLARFYGDPR